MIYIKNKNARQVLKYLIPFILIPFVVLFGAVFVNENKYIFISLCVALLAILLFITGFERRQVGTRRMVIIAVLTALSVAGRFIPFFKPITAITIIAAMYLGAESGFLVGSLSAIISNIYFGQGPWTPFQMLSWGIIGLLAGYLQKPLKNSKILLYLYGALSGITFSFLMDVWTVLWYNKSFELSLFLSAITTAVPYTILYSVSNVIFLLLLAKPFGEKLERIKTIYGI